MIPPRPAIRSLHGCKQRVSSLSINLHTFFQLTVFFQKDWGAFYELKRFFSKIMEKKHEAPGAYSNFSDAWSFGQDSAQALPHLNSQMCADNTEKSESYHGASRGIHRGQVHQGNGYSSGQKLICPKNSSRNSGRDRKNKYQLQRF